MEKKWISIDWFFRAVYTGIVKTEEFTLVNLTKTDKEKKELLKMMTIDVMSAEKRLQSQIEHFIEK